MSKESRFKERFEDDLQRVKKEMGVKENQIVKLNEQIGDFQVKVLQLQANVKEMRVSWNNYIQTLIYLSISSIEVYFKECICTFFMFEVHMILI